MPKLKLTAVAAVATAFASLTIAPAAVAGPWLAPLLLGHVIGAAARIATLPFALASAGPAAAPATPAPYWPGYAAPRPPPSPYYAQRPAYLAPPVGYYGGPRPYYPPPAYRGPAQYGRATVSGMHYPAAYGRAVAGQARGFAYRRW
jgi:hypothetical protein